MKTIKSTIKNWHVVVAVLALLASFTVAVRAGFGNGFTGSPAPTVLTSFVPGNYGQGLMLLTNNVTVQSFTVYGTNSVAPVTLWLYDVSNTNNPCFGSNYVTSSYISRAGYATNTSYFTISDTGYTNYYTNTGYWTYTVTNAASTNILTPNATIVVPGGTVGTYSFASSYQQGIAVFANTNCYITLYLTPNR